MRIIKKVYLSGPITGLPIEEYTALFKMGEKLVRGLKYKPINPVTLNHNHDKSYLSYMQTAIIGMMKADAIMMLPGWRKSNGAVIEHDLAVKLSMHIFYAVDNLPHKVYPKVIDNAVQ